LRFAHDQQRRPARVTQPSPRVYAVITIAVFLICQFGFQTVGGSENLLENFFRSYTWFWLPPLLTLLVLFRGRAFHVWGVTRAPLPMLALSFVISLPVLIGLFLTHASQAVSLETVIATSVLPGLMEELLFRGFLFGLLYRYAGWNFWLAGTVAAFVFGGVHIRQGHDLRNALGVFAITAFGGYCSATCMCNGNPCGFQLACTRCSTSTPTSFPSAAMRSVIPRA
jgi:membrane protease YdiL (CAAX protease family)